jgi:prepilin-type N-terminal cleavage/methylation domain-containing protein
MLNNAHKKSNRKASQKGATLLELIVAVVILTIGLLGTAAAISHAFRLTTMSRNATRAKMIGVSMLEQLENLRNTRRLLFGQIANTGSVDNTGASQPFSGLETNFQPVSFNPGGDGIFGTADDLIDAGVDGIFGTADDFTNNALADIGYSRQVTVTELSPALKRVTVVVRYPGTAANAVELTCIGYLNNNFAN